MIGQPNLNFVVDRAAAARYGINVSDVQDAMQTAVGGNAVTQVLDGEARYDVVLRYTQQYRSTEEAIEGVRLVAERGARVAGAAHQAGHCGRRIGDLSREATSDMSPSSTACAGATLAGRSRRRSTR